MSVQTSLFGYCEAQSLPTLMPRLRASSDPSPRRETRAFLGLSSAASTVPVLLNGHASVACRGTSPGARSPFPQLRLRSKVTPDSRHRQTSPALSNIASSGDGAPRFAAQFLQMCARNYKTCAEKYKPARKTQTIELSGETRSDSPTLRRFSMTVEKHAHLRNEPVLRGARVYAFHRAESALHVH